MEFLCFYTKPLKAIQIPKDMYRFFYILTLFYGSSIMTFADTLDNTTSLRFIQKYESIEEYELENNGLKILLHHNPSMPVATVMITYNVGSRNEKDGVTGATHILEHMMFKGTKDFPIDSNLDYSNQMERIGARSNATTSFDRTNYYATLGKKHVPLAIQLEADRMRNLVLEEDSLASEMIVVRNEYERRENNPYATLQKKIFSTAYKEHPYHHPIIGWKKDIESITVEKLQNFYDTYYWPNNAVLTVIGGFDKNSTLKAIKDYFGTIPRSPSPIPEVEIIEPVQKESRFVEVERSGQVGAVMIANKVPEGMHADWPALLLLSEILGADKIGRLYKALDDKGLASASYIFPRRVKDPGLIFIGATLTAETTHDQIQDILYAEIEKIAKNGVSEEELKQAKSVYLTNLIYSKDGPFQIADLINDGIAIGDWKDYFDFSKSIEQTTVQDLNRVAQTYFKKDQQTTGWFLPTTTDIQQSPRPQNLTDPYYFKESYEQLDVWENKYSAEINFTPDIKEIFISKIHLVTVDLPIEQVVSFSGSISAGDQKSPDSNPLIADLTASMLDKGTSSMDRFEIKKLLNSLGIKIQFDSNRNTLTFSGKFLKKDTDSFMKILADLLKKPKFDEEVFNNLKTQYEAYFLDLETSTEFKASTLLSQNLYPKDHPNYQHSLDELQKSLKAITVEDLKAFHKKHYGNKNMKIVFAGDIDSSQIQRGLRNHFSIWNAKKGTDPVASESKVASQERINYFIPDKTSVSVHMGTRTFLKRDNPDYVPFSVANYILGGSFNSRLMKSIRQEQGLTYSIHSFHEGDIFTSGNWGLEASFSPELLEKGLNATKKEIENWNQFGVTEEEVSQAIETIKGKYLVGLSQSSTVARQIHSFILRGFSPFYIDIYPKLLNMVSKNQVNEIIKKYFDPDSIVTVTSGTFFKDNSILTDINIELEVPNPAWTVQITDLYENSEALIVIAKVNSRASISSQVITRISDTVSAKVQDPNKPIKYYILGKKWSWHSKFNNLTFIKSKSDIDSITRKAKPIQFKKKFL